MPALAKQQSISKTFDQALVERLVSMNKACVLGKLEGDKSLPETLVIHSIIESLQSKLAKGVASGYTFLDNEADSELGLVIAEKSGWDTEHFGVSIDKLILCLFDPQLSLNHRVALLQRVTRARQTRMISARINMLDMRSVQALEQIGAILTDILLTFRFEYKTSILPTGNTGIEVSKAAASETEQLAGMGEKIFKIDRFDCDPYIPSTKSDQLYGKWVSNSLTGLADVVLVARKQNRVIGFITCKIENVGNECSFGIIDLVGVHPFYQGRGIASLLVNASLEWFREKVGSVYAGTQAANNKAVRLYEKSGFRHVSSEASLHLWSGQMGE